MKAHVLRKAIVLAIVLAMALSMGACTSAPAQTAATTDKAAPTVEATATPEPTFTPIPKMDPIGKYDPPITINVARNLGQEVTFAEGEDINNNAWTRAYLDTLGIKLNHVWTVPDADYDKRVSLVIASGDLPDMMPVVPKELKMLVEGGIIEDLTDAYNMYGSEELFKRAGDDANSMKIGTFGGRLMAMPTIGTSPEDAAQVLYIRKDWLDKVGLPIPVTMDELWVAAEKFVENKLGGDTTYAIAISKEIFGQDLADMKGIFNGYHAYPDGWIDDGTGKLVYGSIQPEMKPVLAKLQDFYKRGLIDKEFAVKDRWKVHEDIAAGRFGIFLGAAWAAGYSGGANLVNDLKANWISLKLVSIDDKAARPFVNDDCNNKQFFIVKKGFKNPEALVKMANLNIEINSVETEEQMYKYNTNEKGDIYIFKYIFINANKSHVNADTVAALNDAYNKFKDNPDNAPEKVRKGLKDLIKAEQNRDTDPGNYGWSVMLQLGDQSSFGVTNLYRKENLMLVNKFIGQPTDTMIEKGTSLYDKSIEVFTKIIMGDPIENFDAFVAEWKSTGGDAMTQEVNDWYVEFQKQ